MIRYMENKVNVYFVFYSFYKQNFVLKDQNKPRIVMNFTQLDLLTHKALHPENKVTEVEKQISDFLADEAIISRTQYCQEYFEKHVTARAYIKKGFNVSQNLLTTVEPA
jgi:hypothetical protein